MRSPWRGEMPTRSDCDHREAVTVQGLAGELGVALHEERVVVRPAEHRGDPAGAGTQVDEATVGRAPPREVQATSAALLRNHQWVASASASAVAFASSNTPVSARRPDGRRCRAPAHVASDPRQGPQHGDAVAQHVHLRALVVPPLDGDLEHGDVERRWRRR